MLPHVAAHLPPAMANLPPMAISAIAQYGRAQGGVTPLWFGESDLPTDPMIRAAAADSLAAGETFYQSQSGLPDLRAAIAAYTGRLNGRAVSPERITVTASGMTAANIAMQAVLTPGSNIVIVTPAWPNIAATARLKGAEPRTVTLDADADGRWSLDIDKLIAACDADTKALFINSPNNPTGWVCPADQQRDILDFARSRGLWVMADEVYERLYYKGPQAPSFIALAEEDDLVLGINSFSKTWAMTGFRLGWLTAPAGTEELFGTLVQYTNSSSPAFIQRAGVAAIEQGEVILATFQDYCRQGRNIAFQLLTSSPRIRASAPDGAFYAFFQVDGCTDSMALAQELIRETKVGIAPGIAFGEDGEGWLRLCYAQKPALLGDAIGKLVDYINKR
jgi:aspartate/methionine/tyrosine aminotransferase